MAACAHETRNNLGDAATVRRRAFQRLFKPGTAPGLNNKLELVSWLSSASASGGWWQSFGYDRFGNRWVSGSGGMQYADAHEPTSSSNFNASTNQLFVNGSWYDAAEQSEALRSLQS